MADESHGDPLVSSTTWIRSSIDGKVHGVAVPAEFAQAIFQPTADYAPDRIQEDFGWEGRTQYSSSEELQ
jgi:hypothetical protein